MPALDQSLEPPQAGCRDHGCQRDLYARGLCELHYQRWKKGTDLWSTPIRDRRPSGAFDFERDVLAWLDTSAGPDACHLWTRSTKTKGYGQVAISGRMRGIHQVVWEHAHGPVPAGEMVRHSCGLRLCGNLRHLRTGTALANSADMIAHGTSPRGERNAHVKLSTSEVRQIRDLLAYGWSKYRVARWYEISETAVRHIAKRETWGWLD